MNLQVSQHCSLFFLFVMSVVSIPVYAALVPKIHHSHGISRFDDLKYSADFAHVDYANPKAPKGGDISLFVHGTFNSLNPYSINGMSPALAPTFSYLRYGFSEFNEPLMVGSGHYSPSGDEVKSAYGLIAESVEYSDDSRWIIFNLHPKARFHDGKPITADDVIFSFHALREKGHPRYKIQFEVVDRVEKLSDKKVRFVFKQPGNRTQLFRVAELPVLPAHYWQDKSLDKTSLSPPLNSGPYQITDYQHGVSVTFTRKKDYWGKNLPVNRGKYNFDKVTLYFYRDLHAAFEAFKAGGHDLHLEVIAKNWKTAYDFPAIRKGTVKRAELSHRMAVGSAFFYFNIRRAPFNDIRVRQAVSLLFDYEWTNKALFLNSYKRIQSYFPNTYLAATGLPTTDELKWLAPWKSKLPEKLFTDPFTAPVTNGDGNIRPQQQEALRLLKEAGWELKDTRMVNVKTNNPLQFTFVDDLSTSHRYLVPFKKNLATIGIEMNYIELDAAHYYQRVRSLDFGMIEFNLPQTHSPDQELMGYFHSSVADDPGTRNLPGIKNPAIDTLISRVPQVRTRSEMESVIHSLDRILLWNFYGIPKWHSVAMRVAYKDVFAWPDKAPVYTTPFSTWWCKDLIQDETSP